MIIGKKLDNKRLFELVGQYLFRWLEVLILDNVFDIRS